MIEIMDTTLRDGEQTSGVSFAAHEKLSIAQVLLNDLGVNRVEIASARVSDGEFEAVKRVAAWAARSGNLDKLEVLGFVDGTVSLDWIESAGCRVVNLLCKGSYKHVTEQLRKTPEQHVDDIRTVVLEAAKRKIDVNIYLEDWSNGIKHSPDYVFLVIDALKGLPICRFMLPDTLGVLNPGNTYEYCKMMVDRYPDLRFDFHAHNDYDLAVANVYSAIRAGIKGIHTTVNGLGERAGNAPLSSVLAVVWSRPIRGCISRPISRLSESMCLRNAPVSMRTVIARTTCIATTCFLSVSDGFASMPWARPPEKRISARIWKRSVSTWMRARCVRLRNGSLS